MNEGHLSFALVRHGNLYFDAGIFEKAAGSGSP
jgi:hypothetical protein